ncbi:MAG TPA: HAMP domain-containing sensor histidine kinase [Longilinea sp.]|nr:HAMP domain-containing sensor histidine kinase [Longilinea sp.]
MKLSSLRWRLPISYAAIALITALVLGGILLLTLRDYYREQERTYLMNGARLMSTGIADLITEDPTSSDLQIYLQNLSFLIQARIRIFDLEDTLIADSGSLQSQQFIYTNLNPLGMSADVFREGRAERYSFQVAINILDTPPDTEGMGSYPVFLQQLPTENSMCGYGLATETTNTLQHTDQSVLVDIVNTEGQTVGSLEVSEGLAFGGTILSNVAAAWGVASLAAILVAVVMGIGVSKRLIAPLGELTEVTRQMSNGDLSARVHGITKDEFGLLARSFNGMAERVETLIHTLRGFIADAAHELHTPLTTLRVNLDLSVDDDQNRVEYLETAQSQVLRLQALVDSLLDLSRIEAGKLTLQRLSISKIIVDSASKYLGCASAAGVSLQLNSIADDIYINGDEMQIRRAINNLLDNALKFTPANGTVSLQLDTYDQNIRIIVKDNGAGIPAEDLPYIFRRFHRGRNAAGYPGSGLGLAIVKAIVDQHGGEVKVESSPQGTTVTILLPGEMSSKQISN